MYESLITKKIYICTPCRKRLFDIGIQQVNLEVKLKKESILIQNRKNV